MNNILQVLHKSKVSTSFRNDVIPEDEYDFYYIKLYDTHDAFIARAGRGHLCCYLAINHHISKQEIDTIKLREITYISSPFKFFRIYEDLFEDRGVDEVLSAMSEYGGKIIGVAFNEDENKELCPTFSEFPEYRDYHYVDFNQACITLLSLYGEVKNKGFLSKGE